MANKPKNFAALLVRQYFSVHKSVCARDLIAFSEATGELLTIGQACSVLNYLCSTGELSLIGPAKRGQTRYMQNKDYCRHAAQKPVQERNSSDYVTPEGVLLLQKIITGIDIPAWVPPLEMAA